MICGNGIRCAMGCLEHGHAGPFLQAVPLQIKNCWQISGIVEVGSSVARYFKIDGTTYPRFKNQTRPHEDSHGLTGHMECASVNAATKCGLQAYSCAWRKSTGEKETMETCREDWDA